MTNPEKMVLRETQRAFVYFCLHGLTDEERSFTRAAKRLGVSPSAMSHAMRSLEEERAVAIAYDAQRIARPKQESSFLRACARRSLTCRKHSTSSRLRNRPAGRLRLLLPRLAGTELLAPKLAQFTRDYPDVVLDITADDTHLDIVALRICDPPTAPDHAIALCSPSYRPQKLAKGNRD